MDYQPEYPSTDRPRSAARVRLERMSEPWAIGKVAAVAVTLFFAVLFGSWVASGQTDYVLLVGVWVVAGMIIVFVQDQWWSPALIITALALGTSINGVGFSGYEIGIAIMAITFPVKMAMKTLRKAEPVMNPGILFWVLLSFVAIHAVIILGYNHIQGIPLKNIVKAYYGVIAPLVFYGLMIRYCHTRTVSPGCVTIYCCTLFAVFASLVVVYKGVDFEVLGDYNISVGWLSAESAIGILRQGPITLFLGAIAFWPVCKSFHARMLLVAGIVIGLAGVLMGGGRTTLVICFFGAGIFAFIRNRIWMAVPVVVVVALVAAISTSYPDQMNALPPMFQRALAPFNFSDQKTEEQESVQGSDDWHKALRMQSLDYWFADTGSFWIGHGFKAWDDSLSEESEGFDFQRHVDAAIEMGRTENMVSSITNIFGLTGLLLCMAFLIDLLIRLWRAWRILPDGDAAKAICEFSIISLVTSLAFCLLAGGTPSFLWVYWSLGLVAARPFIAAKVPVEKFDEPQSALPAFIPKDLQRAR